MYIRDIVYGLSYLEVFIELATLKLSVDLFFDLRQSHLCTVKNVPVWLLCMLAKPVRHDYQEEERDTLKISWLEGLPILAQGLRTLSLKSATFGAALLLKCLVTCTFDVFFETTNFEV